MDRQEIYQRIDAAKTALMPVKDDAESVGGKVRNGPKSVNDPVTKNAHIQYTKETERIFGVIESTKDGSPQKVIIPPKDALTIIKKVQTAKTKSTLRKRARAVRYVASIFLKSILKAADHAQRNNDWATVESLVSNARFEALTILASMLPADYDDNNWEAQRRRKGKKSSLLRLPEDWRELMAAKSTGQYRIPMIVALMSGCRPAELESGVTLKIVNNELYVHIIGAKVKKTAGQETRKFRLADHPLTTELRGVVESEGLTEKIVQVKSGNSVTTHMRSLGKKIWPKRKESITAYTARHAIAADCKAASAEGADEDLVSKVLGHIVDKTASYYGARSQSGRGSIAPSEVSVPRVVRNKQRSRSSNRMIDGKMANQKNGSKSKTTI
jgi:integrase